MGRAKVIVLAICVATAMAWLSQQSLAISIEREQPVRVTNRNSGPRYELEDDVEKTKLPDSTSTTAATTTTTDSNNNNQDDKRNSIEQPAGGSDDAPAPIGHMSIRRVFLVPVMSAGPRPDWQSVFSSSSSSNEQPQDKQQPQDNSQQPGAGDNAEQQQPGLLTRPFWPFLTPPIRFPAHHGHQHLFGSDDSSRPSPPASEREREREGDSMLSSGSANSNNNDNSNADQAPLGHPGARPMFDPIQMMLDMMHAALSGQLAPPENPLHDLANEANSRPDADGADNSAGDKSPSLVTDLIRRPMKPTSNNETKEDVVEIDGKKFLRKVVINRHVGENMVFMTKRLIFTPLNETSTDSASATTTVAPNTNAPVASDQENAASNKPDVMSIDRVDKPLRDVPAGDEPTTTTTTTTTTSKPATSDQASTTTAAPSTTTTATANEEPTTILASSASSPTTTTTTTSAQPEDTTTTKADNSWVARVSDAIEKAAERMVDDAEAKLATITSTTTDKPASTESLV